MGIARGLAVGVALVALALAQPLHAQDTGNTIQEARGLADRGYALFKQGDYAEAIGLFKQAERLSHSPVILSFIAQSYEALGELIEAQQQYARIINEELGDDSSEDFREAQRRARRQLPMLVRRIPRLLLRVSGVKEDDLEVELDGSTLPSGQLDRLLAINPGRHRLVVHAPEREPILRTFKASERQQSEIDVMFAPAPALSPTPAEEPKPADLSWLPPSLGFAVGGAALTVSVVTAAIYFDRAAALKERCPDNRCPEQLEVERDNISMLGTVSLASFGVGALGVGAGTLLLFLRDDEGVADKVAGTTITARVGPFALGIEGRF
jgi:tetratricopeptide (TPR) repeat protein